MLEFIQELKQKIKAGLPGEIAHQSMIPAGRPISSLARETAAFYLESAVSVILFPRNEEIYFYLMQRHVYKGAHSGQVSFPGGKKDENDADLIQTAIRETREEFGFQLSEEQLIGELTSVFIPVSKFNMQSFLFCLSEEPTLSIDAYEVESLLTVSLTDLLSEESVHQVSIPLGDGHTLKNVPCFILNEKVVWGATALVLNELKLMLKY